VQRAFRHDDGDSVDRPHDHSLFRALRARVAQLGLIALVATGCQKDYGRGVLLTLLAPDGVSESADRIKLAVFGDPDPGEAVTTEFLSALSGRRLFHDTNTEALLYKARSESTAISLYIWGHWRDRVASTKVDVPLAASTTRVSATLLMDGGSIPSPDIAQQVSDLALLPTDFSGIDLSGVDLTEIDMAPMVMCSPACSNGATCTAHHWSITKGPNTGQYNWNDCNAAYSSAAATAACQSFAALKGGECLGQSNSTCGAGCERWLASFCVEIPEKR
jgi:hypothetical protein